MVDKNLLEQHNIDLQEVEEEVQAILQEHGGTDITKDIEQSIKDFEVGSILTGRVLEISGNDVVIDVGYKSEGIVSLDEFGRQEDVAPGSQVEVLLEAVEDDSGLIVLSKRKADRIRGWEKIIAEHAEGDVVTGGVTRKIKGGLLVDIGVPVFLPASQVDIRRPGDIGDWVGRDVTCKILKIDESRRNIVVSRRKLIEEEREERKKELMAVIEGGQVRKGVVKNIADFGAFVDLGGIDGLLHITDMSWGRISHPSEMVAIDQEIEIKILNVDKEKEKIALGLKQLTASPWEDIETKYPVGSRTTGQVVNVTSYGAFVKLETGVEGLVHISEMSWTRRINHPSEVVAIGDTIEVVVLSINKEKQEISLGMKQTELNPWTLVEQKYPPNTQIKGRVRNLTNYGAFIELEEGIDGLLHLSDMSWTRKVTHPSEIVKKGDKVEVIVLSVDQEKKRVALGLKQLQPDPWDSDIPSKYKVGDVVHGKVTKIASFGVFVELENGLEGLLHISELSERKVQTPEEVVNINDEVNVRIIKVDPIERKIGLSLRTVKGAPEDETGVTKAEAPPAEEEQPEPPAEEPVVVEKPAAEAAAPEEEAPEGETEAEAIPPAEEEKAEPQ
ncbi:MAG: 30S ribosomal protein S1 [Planctomycetes bacterium]|nr:30S ribosomal protein S1 [Planctomycetota bacterium]